MKLTAVIYEEDEDYFVGWCPEIGVATHGDNPEHALAMIKEAAELHLDGMTDKEIQELKKRNVGNMQIIRVPLSAKPRFAVKTHKHVLTVPIPA